MADFDAKINLDVTSNKALNSVTKVEAALDKLNKAAADFNQAFLGQTERRSAFAVAQAQQLAAAIRSGAQEAAKFNAELERTARLAANIRGNRALPPAQIAGALPAARGTSRESIQFRDAIRLAEEIDKNYTEAYRQLLKPAEDFRRFAAEISGALNQKLLPAASSARAVGPIRNRSYDTAGTLGGTNDSYGRQLQKEVARQIQVTGKLNKEILELVDAYNKRQKSSAKLIRTEGLLSTEIRKEAEEYNDSKPGTGRSRGFNGLQQAALGVGFPLLFGGGPGSILGGGLGALGGFGGSVLGSALGGQLDEFAQKAAELGQALNDPINNIEAITDSLGVTGTETQKYIAYLEESGRAAEAASVATAELAALVGQDGVRCILTTTNG